MRPLTDQESKLVFEKIYKFIGNDVERLINRKDEKHVFRLHKNRIYYLSESQLLACTNFSRDKLLAMGTLFGKITNSGKFHLTIHCLNFLAKHSKYKIWLKPNSEMTFLYGHNVTKAGLAKMTENTPQNGGVVVFNMLDIPLGFGLAAQSTELTTTIEPTALVLLHQADIGEYLRSEREIL